MYDDFNNPAYDGSYNKTLWENFGAWREVKPGQWRHHVFSNDGWESYRTLCQELR